MKFYINDNSEPKFLDCEKPKVNNKKIIECATKTEELYRNFWVVFEISQETIDEIKKEQQAQPKLEIKKAICPECGIELIMNRSGNYNDCPNCGKL